MTDDEGSESKIEPVAPESLVERQGRLIVPRSGHVVGAVLVTKLQDADRGRHISASAPRRV